jgi:hypothetical protein
MSSRMYGSKGNPKLVSNATRRRRVEARGDVHALKFLKQLLVNK